MIQRAIYCRSRSPVALAIRLGDGVGPWAHCAGLIDPEHVIEARGLQGVVITPLTDLIRRSSEFALVDYSVPDIEAGRAWARSTVGARYDWGGAIGVPWRRAWQDGEAWYCSEHLEQWLARAGLARFRAEARGIGPNRSYWAAHGVLV